MKSLSVLLIHMKKSKGLSFFPLCDDSAAKSDQKSFLLWVVVEAKNTELCNKRSYPIKCIDSVLTLKWIGQQTSTELTEMFKKCLFLFLDKSLRTNLSIANHDFCRSIFCWTSQAT